MERKGKEGKINSGQNFPEPETSDRSRLIPLERNDRAAIHEPEWLGALIFRSSYEKKASREATSLPCKLEHR